MASGHLLYPPPQALNLDSRFLIHTSSAVSVSTARRITIKRLQREGIASLEDIVSDANVEQGQEPRRLLEARADELCKALDLCLQVKGYVSGNGSSEDDQRTCGCVKWNW